MKMYWKILSWWENNSQLGMLKQWRYSMSRKYYMKMYWWYAPSLDWWYHCRFSHQETSHLSPGHKIFTCLDQSILTCLDQRNYSASHCFCIICLEYKQCQWYPIILGHILFLSCDFFLTSKRIRFAWYSIFTSKVAWFGYE
jgi:hypothetical protein